MSQQIYSCEQSARVHLRAIAFNLVAQLGIGIFAMIFADLVNLNSMWVQLSLMLLLQGAFLLALYTHSPQRLGQVRQRAAFRWPAVAISVLICVVMLVCYLSTSVYFSVLLQHIGYATAPFLSLSGPLEVALAFVVVCVVAPIVEELVFRYALLDGLRQLGAVPAVVLSALAFSLMHMNPEQTTYQFCIGIVLAITVICTDSIIPAIVIHAANNIIGLGMEWLPASADAALGSFYMSPMGVGVSLALVPVGVVAIYWLVRWLRRHIPRPLAVPPRAAQNLDPADEGPTITAPRRGVLTVGFVVLFGMSIVVCFLMWVLVLAMGLPA